MRAPDPQLSDFSSHALSVCVSLTDAISRSRTLEDIYTVALDALGNGLDVSRASILLFDPDGVMRFKAFRGLSDTYRRAVEGHTPWKPDSPDPQPIVVPDVTEDASLAPYLPTIRAEGIAGMAFVPLVTLNRVVGKFMLYSDTPRRYSDAELRFASLVASQVAFAVERTKAETELRRTDERLLFALDAASMGTWDWDLETNTVRWSANLARLHGLPPDAFDGTFASYEREIHPDDRSAVLASARRAIADGVPHDVEYRIVSPDGTVRWVEGKGRVEYRDGRPVRMTGVCMMVGQRKALELARLAAAEEASRLKDEFLATLSHELRSPMNVIVGWVDLIIAQRLDPDRLSHAIDIIGRNARLQAQLIEDVLEVSRIVTGKLDIEHLPVMMRDLVDTVINGVLPAAESKGVELTKTIDGSVGPIEGDPKRLHQALSNVVSNAVKFTPPGGRVQVRCWTDKDAVHVEVSDTGIGIDPAFLPFVFDRFRQADTRFSRRHGGLGLGLAISRQLIEMHRGTIQATSAGEGRGTTIHIALPRLRRPARAPLASRASAAPLPDEGLRRSTVVVVDDQVDSRELLATLLSRSGADVVPCDSARAALQALEAHAAQLLVADIAMPDVDGHELIRQVRTRYPDMPAVAVSAYARPQDRSKALESGYNAYCTKPLDSTRFLETVREVLVR
jgi:signal transduction histidine kinase/CheY-like chemotaxis protein